MNVLDYAMAQMCRVCESSDELISLLDTRNKSIVKKLQACADISIDSNDCLPKYFCKSCSNRLEFAYKFKIQCEYTDRKLRDIIAIQKNVELKELKMDGTADATLMLENVEVLESNGLKFDYYTANVDNLIDVDSEQILTEDDEDEEEEEEEEEEEMPTIMEDDTTDESTEIMYLETTDYSDKADCVENIKDESGEMSWGNDDRETESTAEEEMLDENSIDDTELNNTNLNNGENEEAVTSTTISITALQKRKNSFNKLSQSGGNKKPFQCDTCTDTFEVYADFNEHKKTHGKQRYQCPICERWFSKRYHMKNHQEIHNGLKQFECNICSKRYTNQGNLHRHIRVFHQNEKQHTCLECGKSFSQVTVLRQHSAVHMTERHFSCGICEKSFKTNVHLKSHMLRHKPKSERPKRTYKPPKKKHKPLLKQCVCTECGKHSNTVALHLSHMKTHSGKRPYECNVCNKRFSFQQSLRNHIYLHTGEKPFTCDICGMKFRQIGHLQGHKLVHSGIKQHTCLACGKSFALRGNLTVHMRLHTGETPYHCNVCPKKFYDSNGLKRHRSIHERKNEISPNELNSVKMNETVLSDKSLASNGSDSHLIKEVEEHATLAETSNLGNTFIITNEEDGTQYEVELPADGDIFYNL